MYPRSIQKLIEIFSSLPGVGPRTAARFVFYLLKSPQSKVQELVQAVQNLQKEIRLCKFCFNPYEVTEDQDETGLCLICRNPSRERLLLCVVEKESDLQALEKTKKYNGLYFILGGTVGSLRKEDMQSVRAQELKARIESPGQFGLADAIFKEIILATNPTTEGEATALYIERVLKPLGIKTTRLGRGLAIGAELEYADDETLRNALEGRR